ncbi:hypothetical protein RchiOBHm_Chr1g0362711 [Rosa chinensis]|uniref:Uncharacterized protein n=1 Tax=Rosa chinensis TaxID=74649 RepID=A0A2P6SJ91_ROSCH|nr:uncharacterized protein LOC112182343 isoform X1 [Rosa chinensis]PRQ58751.1 hypothetical protein RchiOBHm_Chr1g0362711 [Rosa chinensis]
MASTTGGLRNREIKLLKADGRQFVRRKDKLQDGSRKTGTKSDEQTIATSLLPEGTKAVEPNNATSPHEVAVPSLDRLDLNQNSDGAIEDLSESAWLRNFLDREAKRSRTIKWKRLRPPDADFSSLRNCLIDPPGEAV